MPHINSNRVRAQERNSFTKKKIPLRRERLRVPTSQAHNKHFQIQNQLRALLERVRPRSLKPQNIAGTGVDYIFAGNKIDFKFSFGSFGENTIKVRLQNGKLLNESDWTMMCNSRGDITIIPTDTLRTYVRMNAAVMKKNFLLNKGTYSEHHIDLKEMLGEVQKNGSIRSQKLLLKSLQKMNHMMHPELHPKSTLFNYREKQQRIKLASAFRHMGQPQFNRKISQNRNRQ